MGAVEFTMMLRSGQLIGGYCRTALRTGMQGLWGIVDSHTCLEIVLNSIHCGFWKNIAALLRQEDLLNLWQ